MPPTGMEVCMYTEFYCVFFPNRKESIGWCRSSVYIIKINFLIWWLKAYGIIMLPLRGGVCVQAQTRIRSHLVNFPIPLGEPKIPWVNQAEDAPGPSYGSVWSTDV